MSLLRSNTPYSNEISAVNFGLFREEEIRKMSVLKISTPIAFDVLSNPTRGGLYDRRLGPSTSQDPRCETCGFNYEKCPGHFGHIELTFPVYNPLGFSSLVKLLKACCLNCFHFKKAAQRVDLIKTLLYAVDTGDVGTALRIRELLDLPKLPNEKYFNKKTKSNAMDEDEENEEEAENEENEEEKPEDDEAPNEDDKDSDYFRKLKLENYKELSVTIRELLDTKGDSIPTTRDKKSLNLVLRDAAIENLFASSPSCLKCGAKSLKWKIESKKNIFYPAETYVPPQSALEWLKKIYEVEPELLDHVFGRLERTENGFKRKFDPNFFFVSTLLVPPCRFRPSALINGMVLQHTQSKIFTEILNDEANLKSPDSYDDPANFNFQFLRIQHAVNSLFQDSGLSGVIEKKEGLFRMHMMGKRVNFAARSVISPDPLINTNEVGVPEVFARTLTFPEPVTPWNYKVLAKAVINGPNIHPGATIVEEEDGRKIALDPSKPDVRRAFAKLLLSGGLKKVHRHLRDGDAVLFNRQPSLHKPSIMGHFVKVLREEKTFRLHYANCATYNADFDGDEMNCHFPQSEQARAEIFEIVNADQQYITARHGGPLRGLIQDSVVSGVLLTKRDTFFTKGDFNQLVFGACARLENHKIVDLPPPAIIKAGRRGPLWTGKQVITAVMNQITCGQPKLSLDSKSKVPDDMWGKGSLEGTVLFSENELLVGVLDKNQFGATAGGLVHACYELYGAKTAGVLLSTLSRLFVLFLQSVGFTCGMDDLLMQSPAEESRQKLLSQAHKVGYQVGAEYGGVKDASDKAAVFKAMQKRLRTEEDRSQLDSLMKSSIQPLASQIVEECIPNNQVKRFPNNSFSLMTVSGAKGSVVNFSQVSCLLGQQELEGKRVPVMASGKTLPSFEPFDPTARAGGFVSGRFLTGIKPQEYFFHCMAGREGLIDTAVKTSRSGYLQRCLVKHLESLKVHYDNTVRDSEGSVIQFLYGEDGIDTMKTGFLNKFQFLAMNYDAVVEKNKPTQTKRELEGTTTTVAPISDKQAKSYHRKYAKDPSMDPIISVLDPNYCIGAVSDKFYQQVRSYVTEDPDGLLKKSKNRDKLFESVMHLKYRKSLAQPGENVGTIAAQSIGEPSTQMTLNTFHLAGRGDVNVTLGIPRLREILMSATRKIQTPTMTLPLLNPTMESAEELVKLLQPVYLIDALNGNPTLKEGLNFRVSKRVYVITLNILSEDDLIEKFNMNYDDLLEVLKTPPPRKSNSSATMFQELVVREINSVLRQEVVKSAGAEDMVVNTSSESKGDPTDDGEILEEADKDDEDEAADDEPEAGEDPDSQPKKKQKQRNKPKARKLLNTSDVSIRFNRAEQYIEIELRYLLSYKLPIFKLANNVATKYLLKQVAGIKKCLIIKDKSGKPAVQTLGSNLVDIRNFYYLIDWKNVYCNDIYAIYTTLGVNAARSAIVHEVSSVFKVYGISVDNRHLGLIADYMTHEGKYRAMNRIGMKSNESPLAKMSFETAPAVLTTAVLHGDFDPLTSPSARIALGLPILEGTGMFDIVQPLQKMEI